VTTWFLKHVTPKNMSEIILCSTHPIVKMFVVSINGNVCSIFSSYEKAESAVQKFMNHNKLVELNYSIDVCGVDVDL
jgi:uncharacterized lipoprotein YajG